MSDKEAPKNSGKDSGGKVKPEAASDEKAKAGSASASIDTGALIAEILGDAAFVDGVTNIVAEHLKANPPEVKADEPIIVAGVDNYLDQHLAERMKAEKPETSDAKPYDTVATDAIAAAVDKHLDEHLAERVKAAMPETAAQEKQRRAGEAADAQRNADKRAEKAREKEARAQAEARAKSIEESRKVREKLLSKDSADPAGEPIDLSKVRGGMLFLDNGDHLAVDFKRSVAPVALTAADGNRVLLKSPAISVGEDLAEPFTATAVVMALDTEDGAQVLTCRLPQPVTAGGGSQAKFGADSLVFRPV